MHLPAQRLSVVIGQIRAQRGGFTRTRRLADGAPCATQVAQRALEYTR